MGSAMPLHIAKMRRAVCQRELSFCCNPLTGLSKEMSINY